VKCEICGSEIKTGIMGKIKGTYVKRGGRLYAVCADCQRAGVEKIEEKIGKRV